MKSWIITVGNELLDGRTINSNAALLGTFLDSLGLAPACAVSVGDREDVIARALQEALEDADVVLISGGLGPTHDDVTREGIARAMHRQLVFHPEVYAWIEAYFARTGRRAPESNRRQAMVPEGFEALPNPAGTAPILWFEGEWRHKPRWVVALPGVPHELRAALEQVVRPRLERIPGRAVVLHRTLRTAGLGESSLMARLEPLEEVLEPGVELASLPSTRDGVTLRLTARGADEKEVRQRLEKSAERIYARIGRWIYGEGDITLEAVVGDLLRTRGLTLATAESCTGGLVSDRITDVPGASTYFRGGVVAYDNEVKIVQLGVDPRTLELFGAVSEEVARQMAQGARDRLRADVGLAITGVAGPSGGTPEKPVGTVYVGVADAHGDAAIRLQLTRERRINKELSALLALNILRLRLLEGATFPRKPSKQAV